MDLHKKALQTAKNYLDAEGDLLLTLIEVDREKEYEKYRYTHLTPYCIQLLGLSEGIAETFVRVVRKSHEVPELAESVLNGEVSLYKAKAIVSALNKENQEEWINKAKTLSK